MHAADKAAWNENIDTNGDKHLRKLLSGMYGQQWCPSSCYTVVLCILIWLLMWVPQFNKWKVQ